MQSTLDNKEVTIFNMLGKKDFFRTCIIHCAWVGTNSYNTAHPHIYTCMRVTLEMRVSMYMANKSVAKLNQIFLTQWFKLELASCYINGLMLKT